MTTILGWWHQVTASLFILPNKDAVWKIQRLNAFALTLKTKHRDSYKKRFKWVATQNFKLKVLKLIFFNLFCIWSQNIFQSVDRACLLLYCITSSFDIALLSSLGPPLLYFLFHNAPSAKVSIGDRSEPQKGQFSTSVF